MTIFTMLEWAVEEHNLPAIAEVVQVHYEEEEVVRMHFDDWWKLVIELEINEYLCEHDVRKVRLMTEMLAGLSYTQDCMFASITPWEYDQLLGKMEERGVL